MVSLDNSKDITRNQMTADQQSWKNLPIQESKLGKRDIEKIVEEDSFHSDSSLDSKKLNILKKSS